MSKIEKNKLIAAFMGATFNTIDKSYDYRGDWIEIMVECVQGINVPYNYSMGYLSVDSLKYDYDFSWLMPVVEKIENLKIKDEIDDVNSVWVEINRTYCQIFTSPTDLFNKAFVEDTKIEAVYNCVVEFIEWYNQYKQK